MVTSTGIRLTPGIVFKDFRKAYHHLLWFETITKTSTKPGGSHTGMGGRYTVLPEYYIPIVTQYLQMTNDELRTTAEWNVSAETTHQVHT
ncbi:unnamed protein product [Vitrella brassicaformis CCMP3155]|uniref:Uncharacterized protein n=1 Tax=Vitrella brassicaformis (strain CCMP3155) TaxID=1169540 RepID=A0A0G4GNL3_VITBC|nr:unnamed protein product [Vitrella brassicaformis CCMP3155]|eukprot:CEM31875.1 unnamed protein product [Vitrella brassicaformis CCMP3155]